MIEPISLVSPRRQRGLSLVELMIALTIALILSVGLIVLASNTSRAFLVQDDFARLQENGTAALRYIVDDIRMAGFYGLATNTNSTSALDSGLLTLGGITPISGDCAAGPPPHNALYLPMPIDVMTGLTPLNVNTTLGCILGSDFAANSPVIILRGAIAARVTTLDANTLYVQSTPTAEPNTILFAGNKLSAVRASPLPGAGRRSLLGDPDTPTGADAPIFEYQTHVYYLRPCSRPTPPATTCAGGEDGGQPIPTLVRQELVPTGAGQALALQPLVEGIERVSLVFGLDTTSPPDGVAELFTNTPPTTVDGWQSVVSIRVSILARTTAAVAGYSDADKTYDLGGGITFNCVTDGASCSVRRHVFSQIASVRNCTGRRSGGATC